MPSVKEQKNVTLSHSVHSQFKVEVELHNEVVARGKVVQRVQRRFEQH
jgi:hypothetical protein